MTDRVQLPVTGTISGLAEQGLINDALLALATQFYSGTAPATTHPLMLWADTTNMVVWQRDAADSAWILRDTLDLAKTIAKTGTYTALLRDVNKVITCAGTFALNLTAVGTLTAAWKGVVRCTSGAVTITPAAGTINGASTLVLSAGQSAALSNDGTNWFASLSFTNPVLSSITASLGADVALNNTANYFDGPAVAQGNDGIWFVSGSVVMRDTAGADYYVKLWDGTTLIASTVVSSIGSNWSPPASLSGFIVSPAGNLRISVRDLSTVNGMIKFSQTGLGKDGTITAMRIG